MRRIGTPAYRGNTTLPLTGTVCLVLWILYSFVYICSDRCTWQTKNLRSFSAWQERNSCRNPGGRRRFSRRTSASSERDKDSELWAYPCFERVLFCASVWNRRQDTMDRTHAVCLSQMNCEIKTTVWKWWAFAGTGHDALRIICVKMQSNLK